MYRRFFICKIDRQFGVDSSLLKGGTQNAMLSLPGHPLWARNRVERGLQLLIWQDSVFAMERSTKSYAIWVGLKSHLHKMSFCGLWQKRGNEWLRLIWLSLTPMARLSLSLNHNHFICTSVMACWTRIAGSALFGADGDSWSQTQIQDSNQFVSDVIEWHTMPISW